MLEVLTRGASVDGVRLGGVDGGEDLTLATAKDKVRTGIVGGERAQLQHNEKIWWARGPKSFPMKLPQGRVSTVRCDLSELAKREYRSLVQGARCGGMR
jgi:hypothetical protein